jgi:hypothetical protein
MIIRNAEYHWTADEIALLGTMPDQEIAVRRGCTRQAGAYKRWTLGIAAFRKKPLKAALDKFVCTPIHKMSPEEFLAALALAKKRLH